MWQCDLEERKYVCLGASRPACPAAAPAPKQRFVWLVKKIWCYPNDLGSNTDTKLEVRFFDCYIWVCKRLGLSTIAWYNIQLHFGGFEFETTKNKNKTKTGGHNTTGQRIPPGRRKKTAQTYNHTDSMWIKPWALWPTKASMASHKKRLTA